MQRQRDDKKELKKLITIPPEGPSEHVPVKLLLPIRNMALLGYNCNFGDCMTT
jgi:hypothetical protein